MYGRTRHSGLGSEVSRAMFEIVGLTGHDACAPPSLLLLPTQSRPLQVARRILMGTYALSAGYYDAYYKRAQQVCRQNTWILPAYLVFMPAPQPKLAESSLKHSSGCCCLLRPGLPSLAHLPLAAPCARCAPSSSRRWAGFCSSTTHFSALRRPRQHTASGRRPAALSPCTRVRVEKHMGVSPAGMLVCCLFAGY